MARILQNVPTVFKMYIPYRSSDADVLGRTGQYPICVAAHLIDILGQCMYRKSNFNNNYTLTKQYDSSVVASDYTISNNWHKKTRNAYTKMEFILTMYLVHIGRSSIHALSIIQDTETGEEYGVAIWRIACMEKGTHKSTALPKMNLDLTENLRYLKSHHSFLLRTLREVPIYVHQNIEPQCGRVFNSRFQIKPGYIDFNNHTNNTAYLRFCMDSAALAISSGHLKGFKGDIALYNVHKGRMLYSKETVLGDQLDVLTWPSKDAQLELCFLIKRGEEVIYSCTLSFYPLAVPSSKY